ncbi:MULTISPECIES: hypothetical protein [Thermomicrobium]|jgi:hypothetical protein|uniref:NifU family protein n=1 Tax=Thermomicrobium roseum (strain ATCC 27502 / DSM 5159 / P-2) TaxID=309801 RepID=B9KXV9_THERP|nr:MULTISPECIES: hypothetical protein [Thermomicrobium]ACM04559.1 hypothetical protein trd_0301 [Thermomicrobium roseum DSM 5159]MBO9307954.1 hypothetical protein [Thermomicrobium sp.]MBO9359553.1 hypothetical protein [Thermomicrobium sp.]
MSASPTVLRAIDRALDRIREGLAPDGFELRVERVTDEGIVELVLQALPDACLDCLVPDQLLDAMLRQAIAPVYPALREVRLEKRLPEEGR